MGYIEDLELRLCRQFDRKHCVYVAGATAGIFLALRAATIQDSAVALPAGVCINVPLAVLYSGNHPLYLDHEPLTLGLCHDDLVGRGGSSAAVIAVHAYGNPCDIIRIADVCRARNSLLIEDLAPALGASIDGRPVGSFGDVAVVSFGAGKIIDVGGGGAVLTDDPGLAKDVARLNEALAMTQMFDKIEEVSRWHTQLYNAHYGRDLNSYAAAFLEHALALRDGFVHRISPDLARKALHAMDELPEVMRCRALRWRALDALFQRLALPGISIQRPPEGAVPWRFNLFVYDGRDALLKRLLLSGIKVSSWFPPADLYLVAQRGDGDGDTPVAAGIGREILNFWVNDEVDDQYVAILAKEFLHGIG